MFNYNSNKFYIFCFFFLTVIDTITMQLSSSRNNQENLQHCISARKKTGYFSKNNISVTLVCRAGPLPIVNRQKAFVLPIACLRLIPRLIVTVRQPGKQCSRLSALSWKLGGQVFMSICSVGMASAAIMA